jgi:predicted nucleic acid-binding protein
VATYLLDTNVLIQVLRGRDAHSLESLVEQGHLLASCAVTVAEIYAGMNPKEETPTRAFVESLEYLPITLHIAEQAGLLKRDYARRGRTLSIADAMIAAVALANNCTLITGNARDFPMRGLAVQSF